MNTKRYIRIIVALLFFLTNGVAEMWAEVGTGDIKIMNTTGGSVTVNSVEAQSGDYKVTMTATLASGYEIKKKDFIVTPVTDPSQSRLRQAPGIAATLEVEDGTSANQFYFILPARYNGAIVTANFSTITPIEINDLSDITNPSGNYRFSSGFSASGTPADNIGSATNPFKGKLEGHIDGKGDIKTISLSAPLFEYVKDATIKNIVATGTINGSGNVGAIAGNALGASRIYNCGVLATAVYDLDGNLTGFSGSSVSGSTYVGGIVGFLDGTSRVINCYSYANVIGGSYRGGIVGYNNVSTVSTTAADLKTMVMNCMFYGNISGGSIAPIYNGTIITNDGDADGVNNFNYFWAGASYVKNKNINKYNCALSAETRFLQRFEFYRNLLNSNRELAAWWVKGSDGQKSDMAKWVLEPSQIGSNVPFPILKTPGYYPSVVNYTPNEAPYDEDHRNEGRKLTSMGTNGKLSVTIKLNSNTGSTPFSQPNGADFKSGETGEFDLIITDKDTLHYNFNYGKVQLPYYNDYCVGNYTGNRVVTGWKIVSITGGTAGSYTTGAADVTYDANGNLTATPYNFADRQCTDKDLYSVSKRVFNQGAYWDVPEEVTAITIEPYWGKAVYLADEYWDVTYKNSGTDAMATAAPVTTLGGGQRFENGKKYDIVTRSLDNANGQTVYTSMGYAIASSGSGSALFQGVTGTPANQTVYDYAVVLVGNYHHTTTPNADNSKPYTVTSVDLDGDNEPDYSLMLRFNSRLAFHPVRYDFLNLIGLGMAQKTTGGTGSYNLGIMQPKYWFEVTNTALFRVTQFEYSPSGRAKKPIILQGGVVEQWVTQQSDAGDAVEYFHVGGNVWFKEFHRGSHQDNANKSTPHPPVSVTGGDFEKFYLTGLYQSQATIYDDNAECYISGGRFGEVAGAGMEGIGSSEGKGNVTWIIDHADIKDFYGGGINYDKPVHGNIHTIIKNSYVTQFCGGPKFGDMKNGRTVKTVADNCTFGTYFGAGYGGNSYNRQAPRNHNNILNFPHNDSSAGNHSSWNNWLQAYYKQDYSSTYKGVSTQFDYQFLPMSGNCDNVARIFVEYVGFSLATTHDVTSSLTGCKVLGNFYGGGSLGKVDGDATSTLTNCTVNGSAFGAGYSASTPTVEVMPMQFVTEPSYDEQSGSFTTGVLPSKTTTPPTDTYTWQHKDVVNNTETAIDKINHILYTQEDLTTLGTVTGNATLNIEGTTTVGGSVYGGGEESGVDSDTEVTVSGGTIGTEGNGGVEYGNVYGGGKGKRDDVTSGLVKGKTKVTIQNTKVDANTTIVPRIYHNVYGGGAYGSVGDFDYDATTGMPTGLKTGAAANSGKTEVEIKGGTFGWNGKENGMIFGSSRGDVGAPGGIEDKLAWVYDTEVKIGTSGSGSDYTTPTIKGSVYGGGENGHNYNNSNVYIYSGTIGIPTGTPVTSGGVEYSGAAYPYRGNVYGGGCGTDKYYDDPTSVPNPYDGNGDHYNPLAGIVQGTATVNISGGHVVHNVYGAGAMGSVGNTDNPTTSGKTTINISGGRVGYDGNENGNVFGAARGEYGTSTAASGLANVRETEVNISYTTTAAADNEGKTAQLIAGSVFGGGEAGTVKESVAVNMTGGLILKDVYGGGALADTQTSNWDATNNTWAAGKSSSSSTTTVRLTGGTILGEAYGGGLGEAASTGYPNGKPAYVWGDVLVDLNGTTTMDNTTHKPTVNGTATVTGDALANTKGCAVGQVFGGNNINGTPKGDVMVHVYATQNPNTSAIATKVPLTFTEPATDKVTYWSTQATNVGLTPATVIGEATADADKINLLKAAIEAVRYDVSAVYGGGNKAAYIPVSPYTTSNTSGAKTQVIIEGCGETSIETVYGGGNAAAVPETNVEIREAYEIGSVFGGGNGKDDIAPGVANPGADVGTLDHGTSTYGTGNANTVLKGGYIHEAYGGSNQKGKIMGKVNINTNPQGTCALDVQKLVGAGKNADVDGDLIMILGCKPTTKTPLVFAGADNADVNGNVELTITSGTFGQVFGGNNLGGHIKGHIKLNIEETGCNPIRIDELYLGGNQAAYSRYGYYNNGTTENPNIQPRTAAMHAITNTSDPNYKAPITNPSNDDQKHPFPYAQPELNVISCTSIGKVFGGGWGAGAFMHANPTVNINMVPGAFASQLGGAHALGAIGDVYGGGNAADVYGDATVNIGTATKVRYHQSVTNGVYTMSDEMNVEGANITGDVFGGGYSADVKGNTQVNICAVKSGDTYKDVPIAGTDYHGVKILGSVYGGGDLGSVGTFTYTDATHNGKNPGSVLAAGKPTGFTANTGKSVVAIMGNAEIGFDNMQMFHEGVDPATDAPDDKGHVFGAGKGKLEAPSATSNVEFISYVDNTVVTIGGNAFVKGSVYGGSENGHVLHDTYVNIQGGQIGCGKNTTARHPDDVWAANYTATSNNELWCPSWKYESPYAPFDPNANASGELGQYSNGQSTEGGRKIASDGHSYFGNVFGGGSGSVPYFDTTAGISKYLSSAGTVEGNTHVTISGGHILTSVYGGCETTNVKGTANVTMTGGTIGVPRTDAQIIAHPVTGYLFGAGKGDQRVYFNKETNVNDAVVKVEGGRIYGSVYGGGEDGHVLRNVELTIGKADHTGPTIGTKGTSYYDGHVFGGGRGFGGEALTAGNVGGAVTLNIESGSVLGSVYGGGRLASVGYGLYLTTEDGYGEMRADDEYDGSYTDPSTEAAGTFFNKGRGHITVNVNGGTIGNENASGDGAKYSGNVFGGSMGRLNLLDGTTRSDIWPLMAQVKSTAVNIYGDAVIRRNVYGGGELGVVRDDAYVTIGGYKTANADADGNVAVTASGSPTVRRDVFGGGYGSEDKQHTIISVKESGTNNTYAYTPMQFAGCVGKNTYVNVVGGYIRKSVYGGGEMASVGVIDYKVTETTSDPAADKVKIGPINNKTYYYNNVVKHGDPNTQFALSWPYKFNYVTGYPGATHVKITGGRLGLKDDDTDTGFEDNGDVYGAGKGMAGDYKDYLFCANVGSTDVVIDHSNNATSYSGDGGLIAGAVYGGGEDGHVMGNAKVTLKKGFVYHSVYGGGSGKGQYDGSLLKIGATEASATTNDYYDRKVYSITAGKVFGNTEVVMEGGTVIRNVYGGGNMGSVGKGNYAGGSDDYSTAGYGEKVTNLWSNTDFTGSGKSKVTITGGTIGYINPSNPGKSMYPLDANKEPYAASLPYGNVFGGCRGEAAPDLDVTPSYLYSPEFFMGYVNETSVEIGKADGTGPTILGSVYGGGMDGHVRRDASVTIKGGEIGKTFDATSTLGNNPDNIQWLARGNVYGAGSGIGEYNAANIQYKDDYTGTKITGTGNSTSAGSVTRFTKVDIQGGTIHRNVYGGGSLASVGAPKIDQTYDEYRKGDTADGHGVGKQTLNEVIISGGKIGGDYSYDDGVHVYGGHVFGGSRGDASLDATKFSTSMFTSITIDANATPANNPVIEGSVFGGGEVGIVKGSVDVTMNGGTVNNDVYGGGALANTNTETSSTVPYTTDVNLYGGLIKGDAYGGGLGQLAVDGVTGIHWTAEEISAAQEGDPAYGKTTNDWKVAPVAAVSAVPALVYGNVAVKLGDDGRNDATAFYVDKFTGGAHDGIVKSGRVFGCNNLNGSPQGTVTVTVNKTVEGNTPKTASTDLKSEDATKHKYHVAAVYGGGNLAGKTVGGLTKVIINGCDVSIRSVYGGGNAAEVPATDVRVNGAYEIGEVFGGGNGKDDYTLDGGTSWKTNPGANVNGNTNTLLLGGLIHEAYGGSNEKGTISGSVSINTSGDRPADCDCELDVEKLVGAGKNADVNGDLIMVLGCKPETKTPLVFGGADNANVNGNVELTITSGTFGQVFGGNNLGGVIRGHITLNIEETGCNPIKIDELYLGGNQAAYSRYGYYNAGTDAAPNIKPRTAEMHAITNTADPNYKAPVGNPTEDANHPFPYAQPVLNVTSCTSIGKVFGGGLGTGAIMHADPTVNINMIPGEFANHETKGVPAVMAAKGLSSDDNPNKLGIIGDVYGGGNAADVVGNPTVNIGTASKVKLHQSYTNGAYSMSEDKTVLGAYINGNVFGGGMGKADEFTCAKAMVGEVDKGIDANNNPLPGGTTVNIYNGTVLGDVYGGGEIGRVERNTKVTIGEKGNTTLTPIIKGHVFGAGAGVETHGYSALVRGNVEVIIQGKAQVWQNVHGGGEKASVGRYNVRQPGDTQHPEVRVGMPYSLKAGGKCTVIIQDAAIIGNEGIIGSGDIYGAGQGVRPNYNNTQGDTKRSKRMMTYTSADDYPEADKGKTWDYYAADHRYVWEYFATKDDYLLYMETLARASETDVIIGGERETTGVSAGNIVASSSAPTVRGSVYGGSESGFVYYNTEVNIPKGTVKGDVFGGGKGLDSFAEAGRVRRNTNLKISGGTIEGNVYGGGSLGDVGTITKNDDYNYTWTKTDGNTGNAHENNKITGENTNTGVCNVKISGGTIGTGVEVSEDGTYANGNVYGAGKGLEDTWWCEKAMVFATNVDISAGTVKGTVYGGGEVGRVEDDAKVTIGVANQTGETNAPVITGNVFGAGAGIATHGYSALVRGNADVTVQGTAQVGGSVYGGGEIASVGRFHVVGGLPTKPENGGYCTVTIQDNARIGTSGTEHNVFGACKGVTPAFVASGENRSKSMQLATNAPSDANLYSYCDENDHTYIWRYYASEADYLDFLKTLALTSHPHVTIAEEAEVHGSVYGGGQRGVTLGHVDVDITGGTISQDVYGGGALADTNLGNWDDQQATWAHDEKSAYYKTKVNILGGTIGGDAYGGGLGQLETGTKGQTGYVAPVEAKVYGDVYVNLNGFDKNEVTYDANIHGATGEGARLEQSGNEYLVKDEAKGAVVKHIFGCNNLNGSPQGKVKVHVFKTQRAEQTRITNTSEVSTAKVKVDPVNGEYNFTAFDVQAVYGGGNMAAYEPKDLTTGTTQVIIDGCDRTSIGQVYGGGNAASAPATEVTINGSFEIAEVFGGGNGKDKITVNNVEKDNPGANVGFKDYSAVESTYDTKEKRQQEAFTSKYVYGTGKAAVNIFGGTIHRVFGGSNTKGNVRQSAITMLEDAEVCNFCVDEAYGGGKSAPMDAEAKLLMACIPGLKEAYGGAEDADVYDDVSVTITNGTFDRVFGGNNLSGTIRGKITVTVEETGCRPVIIGELYGGGNQAGYSVYGYDGNGNVIESGENPLYADPQVNVRSFTSIGTIYGGGYGKGAKMVGNPTVNINVADGEKKDYTDDSTYKDANGNTVKYYETEGDNKGFKELTLTVDGHDVTLPNHKAGTIGAINNVFGGGNAAKVVGNTNVNIGTEVGNDVYMEIVLPKGTTSVTDCFTRTGAGTTASPYTYTAATGAPVDGTTYYKKYTIKGADIRGNVYGGGNNAEVTGNTNVTIGKRIE